MVRLISSFVAILLLGSGVTFAQPTGAGAPPGTTRPEARKFDLDFLGGPPEKLIAAVEKATGEPLNAIIPEQEKDVMLPALKMRQVTVSDLFIAMEQSSHRMETQVTGTYFSNFGDGGARSQYSMVETSYGFRQVGSVWVFSSKRAVPPPDQVTVKTRFYQLKAYLEQNSIEDVTTAIQTAWKMMAANKSFPNKNATTDLKFHKETGLLIAVGDAGQVQVIDDVLAALRPDLVLPTRKTNANPPTKN